MTAPFSAEQLGALQTLRSLWHPHIPFVLVGASAIHCHRPTPRGTRDLDVTLAVALGELPAGLERTPGWRRHARHEHEWIGPGEVSVDLIPADSALLAQGYIDWPGGYRMSLAGFEHAFVQSCELALTPTLSVSVASLPAIALLKMVAFLDRPDMRERDLEDLAYLLHDYAPADDERRWSDELVELQLDFELVSAYLLGRELAAFVTPKERGYVATFLDWVRSDHRSTRAKMARRAPPAWRRANGQRDPSPDDRVLAAFDAFAAGMSMVGAK